MTARKKSSTRSSLRRSKRERKLMRIRAQTCPDKSKKKRRKRRKSKK